MTPSPRRNAPVVDPGTFRLADAIDLPEPRPEARPQRGSPRGPTLPAGFGRPPEAPTPTPWPEREAIQQENAPPAHAPARRRKRPGQTGSDPGGCRHGERHRDKLDS